MGSSGCGKTTLISCFVGIHQLDRGNIEVFGEPVIELRKSRVGYMPQETALYYNFNVRETVWFYGTIFGMSSEKINERFELLSKLLELPEEDKLVRECSGGQQRRISFALTLVHEPELIILDEPTVGVDPLLRIKIWDFLLEITRDKKVTVFLSTHYIEEARQSTCVGVMRNGVLIAEDSPLSILNASETTSLDNAFLVLSQRQDDKLIRNDFYGKKYSNLPETSTSLASRHTSETFLPEQNRMVASWEIVLALVMKNFLQIVRNYGQVLQILRIGYKILN